MTKYNGDGKMIGKEMYSFSEIQQQSEQAISKIDVVRYNECGQEAGKNMGEAKCNGTDVFVGYMLPEVEQSTASPIFFLNYPASMKPGDLLNEKQELSFAGESNGNKVRIAVSMRNRTVTGMEKLKLAAGTWDCFTIECELDIRVKGGGLGLPAQIKLCEWYAPGSGIIKTALFGRDGKMLETLELTKVLGS
ncbi:MAG: hypothetical protein QM731_04435 [Chitinophagaceae bacterium]